MKREREDVPMADDEVLQAMAREMAVKDGDCEIHFSAPSLFRAVALFQLVTRHPEVDAGHREFVRTFIDHAREFFADCPTVLEVIRRGDDPREDHGD